MTNAIWWIRRDLRLNDNQALQEALHQSERVIPVYLLDPTLFASAAPKRRDFLMAGLRQMDADLRQMGSRLVLRSVKPGERPVEALRMIMADGEAQAIFAEEDYTPYAIQRDRSVAKELPLTLTAGLTACHPDAVAKADGRPYTVFTPYSRSWKSLVLGEDAIQSLLPAPRQLESPGDIFSEPIPEIGSPEGFPAGEIEARRRLVQFCSAAIHDYDRQRNRLDLEGTSGLSPYLRFGMLSARQALAAALEARRACQNDDKPGWEGTDTWINELIWREFYIGILYRFPEVLKNSFQPSRRHIRWRESGDDLQAWKDGLTGYPVVDAAMRQLRSTGWMHNRARMIAASFLVKDLLINWQEGERWFLNNLIDGDLAANNGGWQWVAGVGTDAAPYFRIFNPVLQGQKFDPQGEFIRRWVPELACLTANWIHQPWKTPETVQREVGFRPGENYPLPIVDHSGARERALAAYRAGERGADPGED